jgi:hypothetical protein
MKALEILKEYKRAMKKFVDSFDDDCKDDDEYISAIKHIKQLDEAIAELEALAFESLKKRSCKNCKKWVGNAPFRGFCSVTGSSCCLGGCNDYWELKK